MGTEPIVPIGQLPVKQVGRRKYREQFSSLSHGGFTGFPAAPVRSDGAELSPLAELVGTLETLRESDPAKYALVTQHIGTNLLNAAHLAQTQGNSDAADQLTQLAADFSIASDSGQLKSLLRDLSQAAGYSAQGSAGGSGAKLRALLSTHESHSAQNAALDDAIVFVRTVSTITISSSL